MTPASSGNVSVIRDRGLCTGCGICQNVCPQLAVRIRRYDGLYAPEVDATKCKSHAGCSRCLRVCPGQGLPIDEMASAFFPTAQPDNLLGRWRILYTGHCTDRNLRWHGASGGMVTGLLSWMLRRRMIEGAVVTRYSASDPLRPEAFIARTQDELAEARSSKYCPVTFENIIAQTENCSGTVAVVGLPCHIHALRKAAAERPKLAARIGWYVGIYCSATRCFGATEYVLSRMGIDRADVSSFAYRDEGCLGVMKACLKNGSVVRSPYREYYPTIRSFFVPYRCTLCVDHTSELADVSFGDIHIPEFWDDEVGVSSVIVRSPVAERLIRDAVADGWLKVKPVARDLLVKSQNAMLRRKKVDTPIRLRLLSMLGRAVPRYGEPVAPLGFVSCVRALRATVVLYAEIAVGASRRLWWIIDLCGGYKLRKRANRA